MNSPVNRYHYPIMSIVSQQVQLSSKHSEDKCTVFDDYLRLDNIDRFANKNSAEQLKADLETGNYQMNEIDVVTVNQIFSLLKIKDPKCDKNDDLKISGS